MASADSRDRFPEPQALDYADSTVRALVSAIPTLGGPAIRLMDIVITPPLEQRRVNWLNDLARRLEELQETIEGFTVEALAENDEFVTAFTTATLIAVRNHDEEKLAALRSAVVNVALRTEADVERQSVFLSLVDYLTPAHIRLLRFFQAPLAFVARSGRGGVGAVPDTARDIALRVLPGIPPDAYDLLCGDLENRGLIRLPKPPALGLTDERTTELGDRFLRFISEQ